MLVESLYRTQCQLRGSSLSISVDAVQCCSSMKTVLRIFIASLNTFGFVVSVPVSRTSLAFGPGGGCIDVLNFGICAIVLVWILGLDSSMVSNDGGDLGGGGVS